MTDQTTADVLAQENRLIDVYLTPQEIKTLMYKLNNGDRQVPQTLIDRIERSLRTGLER